MNKLVTGQNDLATLFPTVAKEWHPTKNGDLKPNNVLAHSSYKAWWICLKGHDYMQAVYTRTGKVHVGCPVCANRCLLAGYNDLETRFPEIAKEWNCEKNNGLTPRDVICGGTKIYWWTCPIGHEYQTSMELRTYRNQGCPYCHSKRVLSGFNDLETKYPEIASEWHPTKNGDVKACEVFPVSMNKYWWLGKCGHEWQQTPSDRTNNGSGCPYCSSQKVLVGYNDLQSQRPEIAKEWNYEKNYPLLPTQVLPKSNKIVWWVGKCGHEWKTAICHRTDDRNCPYCSNQKVLVGFNDIATTNPEIALEWHPTKNGKFNPQDLTIGSNKRAWWKCKNGHEWNAQISTRQRNGCPYCSGQRLIVGENDLESQRPDTAKEWNYEKNFPLLPSQISVHNAKKVWWKGSCGHEWQSVISSRTGRPNAGCPICFSQYQTSFAEQSLYFYLKKVFPDTVNSDKSFGKELDVYIPSIRTAFEYDGSFWHENSRIDSKKNTICKNNGLKLIRIREYGLPKLDDCICFYRDNNDSATSLEEVLNEVFEYLGINVDIDINRDSVAIMSYLKQHHKDKNLSSEYPDVAKMWNTEKNGTLRPEQFAPHSQKKAWWICENGHEWQATIASLTSNQRKGNGCRQCYLIRVNESRKVSVRSIEDSKIYSTIEEAASTLGITVSGIRGVLRGKHKTCGGFHWEYVQSDE